MPIHTDCVIFLFDNGEKNMIASMLNYAREHDQTTLDHLDFHIVFMGASIEAMSKEPFCFYSDKLIHYKNLGIEETIDHTWQRERQLSQASLAKIAQNLHVQKKVWLGVSCRVFEQLVHDYQNNTSVEVAAVRDNPSPTGDTDYFQVAEGVQNAANKIMVPSHAAALQKNKKVVVVGNGPIEEWCALSQGLDREEIIHKLHLNSQLPIIVYAGTYGENYASHFRKFLELMADQHLQVLIVPHPRYKGIVEKKVYTDLPQQNCRIVGEFEEDPSKHIKTVEAIYIADVVVTADATSTIVFQASAIGKKVLHVDSTTERFDKEMSNRTDVFELLGIPKNGAQLLWQEFLATH